ncbi:glycosyltransferase [Actinomadura sp. HBU206391]|uniref:glycosyltransferase n=1 Tax=Actinomadura sp. HBU206391 TaxID=2731692 RepID=UPI001650A10F|nr:glycosyltransferase [Actinomadura sp. HBU206391]MBC6457897.1 glycosyltransferase [Actinomadura sp. HBU206391]
MRIVQLANLYSPVSGGLRTAVDALGRGYVAAGHDRALVIPGRSGTWDETESGLVVTVPGASVAPGYRFVLDPRPMLRVLARLRPDVIEVSDKATLVLAARWARRRGVRTVLLSHERLDAILAPHLPSRLPLEQATDRWNQALAGVFDAIVVTSEFAAAEFRRALGRRRSRGPVPSLHLVPLGVDLSTFRPSAGRNTSGGPGDGLVRLVHLGRLSREKSPGLALDTVRQLSRRGVPVRLDMAGDGPLAAGLRSAAEREGLPVDFHGHLPARSAVARLLAGADVALATCPAESFGLAVLEALACGTPVVAANRGAARELLAPGTGLAAAPHAGAFGDAVQEVLRWPDDQRRRAARTGAERYPWSATIAGMLDVLTGTASDRTRTALA